MLNTKQVDILRTYLKPKVSPIYFKNNNHPIDLTIEIRTLKDYGLLDCVPYVKVINENKIRYKLDSESNSRTEDQDFNAISKSGEILYTTEKGKLELEKEKDHQYESLRKALGIA